MKKFRVIATAVLSILLLYPKYGIHDKIRFTSDGLNLFNVKEQTDRRGRVVYSVADITYQTNGAPHITDMALSFNSPADSLAKDDTGHYPVKYASYVFTEDSGVTGKGGAKFYRRDDRVEIECGRNLWLGDCTDAGSFTIEFRMKPLVIRNGGVLFSRIGYNSGKRNGIEIVIWEKRISARLYGMFKNSSGKRIDVYLVYATESGEAFNGVYGPSFQCGDSPIAVIGKDYFGYVDEFRIAARHFEDLKKETEIAMRRHRDISMPDRTPINKEGVITSPVYEFPSTGTMIKLFEWAETLKKDTFVWMELRISDRLFYKNHEVPKWYRIENSQRNIYLKKGDGDELLRGKYYQWRAHLVPSPDGSLSPDLFDIDMEYELDPPPVTPMMVETVKAASESVRLKWKKNVDHDIFGYRIYYGVRSGAYDGVLSYINGKRITNEMNSSGNFIEVEIDNKIIDENRALDKKSVLVYPGLKNTVLYFFSITAYDSYKPDTVFNHESKHSKEVTARPYAGSEINR
jgi:hypothetical protein